MNLQLSSSILNLYSAPDGQGTIEVLVADESVWLNLKQIAELFKRDKSVVSRHIKNIFQSAELEKYQVVAEFATTAADGKTYQVEYYNLDMIISIGYRINSKQAVQFRQWATQVLKSHLLKGYSLNAYELSKQSLHELYQALDLLKRTLDQSVHILDIGLDAIRIIQYYARSWSLLLQYDENRLRITEKNEFLGFRLEYPQAKEAINSLKNNLIDKQEATKLFGQEKDNTLIAILGNIEQTFDGTFLYASIAERAAHLLYFIIKDHPFTDGNKRIGCLLFLLYLDLNNCLSDKLNDSALVALTLMVATSDPKEKTLIIRLIVNLIK